MKSKSPKGRGVVILSSYLILSILLLTSLRYHLFQDFLLWFLLLWTLFLIRDIILIFGISKDIKHETIDWAKLRRQREKGEVWLSSVFLLWNRTFLFPIFLVLYIIAILLKQLDIFILSDILSTNSWIEYILLGLVALSGLGTIFRESFDTEYQKLIINHPRTRLFVLTTIVLALIGVAIIFRETASLGLLSLPISVISGLLIFLVGILLLEWEEEDSDEEKTESEDK